MGRAIDEIKTHIKSAFGSSSNNCEAVYKFDGNLPEYLTLQRKVWGPHKKLSTFISFTSDGTSAGDENALALSTKGYVARTWKDDGLKLLQATEASLKSGNEAPVVVVKKYTSVRVHVRKAELVLRITGPSSAFEEIVEQFSWMTSMAAPKPIQRLREYITQIDAGKAREESEVLHTGLPQFKKAIGGFEVKFRDTKPTKHPVKEQDTKPAECWKTMSGLLIVAAGYSIGGRSKGQVGLEVPATDDLAELLRLGSRKDTQGLAWYDPAAWMITPYKDDKEAYAVRALMAVRTQRTEAGVFNIWHFHSTSRCKTLQDYENLINEPMKDASMVNPKGRNFVGWTKDAEFFAASSKIPPEVGRTQFKELPHTTLVVGSVNGNFRLPQLFAFGASLSREMRENNMEAMINDISSNRALMEEKVYILLDSMDGRAWLVNGHTVALQLIRKSMAKTDEGRRFEWQKLKHYGDETPEGVKGLLLELEQSDIPAPIKSQDDAKDKDKDKDKRTFQSILAEIYAGLKDLSTREEKIYTEKTLFGPLKEMWDKHWHKKVRGWEFDVIASGDTATIKSTKFDKDPGWLSFQRDLGAPILLGLNFGEPFKPRKGESCLKFPTVPMDQYFMATHLGTILKLTDLRCKDWTEVKKIDTIARLSTHYAWFKEPDPFATCQNKAADHQYGAPCFPLQSVSRVPRFDDRHPRTDHETLKKHNGKIYMHSEVREMAKKYKNAVVVFGEPDVKNPRDEAEVSKYWKDLAEAEKPIRNSKGQETPRSTTPVASEKGSPSSRAGSLHRQGSRASLSSPGSKDRESQPEGSKPAGVSSRDIRTPSPQLTKRMDTGMSSTSSRTSKSGTANNSPEHAHRRRALHRQDSEAATANASGTTTLGLAGGHATSGQAGTAQNQQLASAVPVQTLSRAQPDHGHSHGSGRGSSSHSNHGHPDDHDH